MREKIRNILKSENGMGVVEIILIILVLVGLSLVFKRQITGIASGIYTSIKTEVGKF